MRRAECGFDRRLSLLLAVLLASAWLLAPVTSSLRSFALAWCVPFAASVAAALVRCVRRGPRELLAATALQALSTLYFVVAGAAALLRAPVSTRAPAAFGAILVLAVAVVVLASYVRGDVLAVVRALRGRAVALEPEAAAAKRSERSAGLGLVFGSGLFVLAGAWMWVCAPAARFVSALNLGFFGLGLAVGWWQWASQQPRRDRALVRGGYLAMRSVPAVLGLGVAAAGVQLATRAPFAGVALALLGLAEASLSLLYASRVGAVGARRFEVRLAREGLLLLGPRRDVAVLVPHAQLERAVPRRLFGRAALCVPHHDTPEADARWLDGLRFYTARALGAEREGRIAEARSALAAAWQFGACFACFPQGALATAALHAELRDGAAAGAPRSQHASAEVLARLHFDEPLGPAYR